MADLETLPGVGAYTARAIACFAFGERVPAVDTNLRRVLSRWHGDILNGANGPLQVVIRPRLGLDPYSTGAAGLYICSAATPPGAGVHGMNGYNAAQSALRRLGR